MTKYEEAGEWIEGHPRSVFELAFVAGMRACKHCGDHGDVEWSSTRFGDGVWRTDGACARCGKERAYLFRSHVDLPAVEPAVYELGGPEPSSVMTSAELVREIERLGPTVIAPARAATDERDRAWGRLERMQIAVNELAKFLVGDTIPMLGGELRARYDRQWIERERARLAALEDVT